ncbi:amidohydrolase family protein [bacterium LRH843]|nr:amidohydrolase family protein [bacterium LRH843]
MKIDSHQHFWKLSRGDYGWLKPEMEVLYRDYFPEDLIPHLQEHEISKTIVVQAAPTMEETEFLLDLYEKTDFIAGVVGWIDLESDEFSKHYRRFRQHKGFVGLRPMLHDISDDRWILRPKVMEHLKLLVEEDFPLDILIFPRHLPHILELLDELPGLRAVIDHCAKPYIAKGELEPWKSEIDKVAKYKNVRCKLSGLITEAEHNKWTVEDLKPYVSHVVNTFGPESVMYGSDWPVCLLSGTYSQVHNALVETLPKELSQEEIEKIFGGNTREFYKLKID